MDTGWTEALALDHPVIDAQHREIFRRYHALAQAAARGDHGEEGRLFEFLGGYVVEHFAAEELLMDLFGYPEKARHRADHDRFVSDFLDYGQRLAARQPDEPPQERLVSWMADWLRSHISVIDRQLATFLAQRRLDA